MKGISRFKGWPQLMVVLALSAVAAHGTTTVSLDGQWLLATDPQNAGRDGRWWTAPRPEAKPTKVPWIIQDAFPGYHGVAWYWREFAAPANPHPGGRIPAALLAGGLQGRRVAQRHRRGLARGRRVAVRARRDRPSSSPAQTNRLAVRVLNPTHEPIDGIVLNETPHRNKALPYSSGQRLGPGRDLGFGGAAGRARRAGRRPLRPSGLEDRRIRVQSTSATRDPGDPGQARAHRRAGGQRRDAGNQKPVRPS